MQWGKLGKDFMPRKEEDHLVIRQTDWKVETEIAGAKRKEQLEVVES